MNRSKFNKKEPKLSNSPNLLKEVVATLFPKETERRRLGRCPLCHILIDTTSFRDELSKQEFYISGMCQQCQDKVFGV